MVYRADSEPIREHAGDQLRLSASPQVGCRDIPGLEALPTG
jgi:hypothetical protein